jgi:hypothetical protein
MSDISMCISDNCPFRQRCARHSGSGTIFSHNQSVMIFAWGLKDGCDGFIAIKLTGTYTPQIDGVQ